MPCGLGLEASRGEVFKRVGGSVQQQQTGGVGTQVDNGLLQKHIDNRAQIEAAADGCVDGAQGHQMTQASIGLLVKRHAANGGSRLIADALGQAHLLRSERFA